MNIPFVDLRSQYLAIKGDIDQALQSVIEKTDFIGGPFVKKFEEEFASYCDARNCVGVGNGTDALFIVLKSLGIGPGDDVITVANSFVATSEAITSAGARVVFVDIDPRTYNIDVGKIEEKITPRTKAIIPVHLYGQPADMDPILDLAGRYGIKVIEDAAQAHGAEYKGRRIGSIGDAACFSFYPGKNLGAYGDAGAVVTNDDILAQKVRMYANHGRIGKYDHEVEGVNSRLDAMQAAVLTVKLKHLDRWNDHRRRNAFLYNHYLENLDVVKPHEIPRIRAVYHLYVVRVDSGKRSGLQKHLMDMGISTGIHYPIALPCLRAYKYLGHVQSDFPHAVKAATGIVSLPMYPELTEEQILYIVKSIEDYCV